MSIKIITRKILPFGGSADTQVQTTNIHTVQTTGLLDTQVSADRKEVERLAKEVREAHTHIHDDVDDARNYANKTQEWKNNAHVSANEAGASADAAKVSETNAKQSEDDAHEYRDAAHRSAVSATADAETATEKASVATTKANEASASATNAAESETNAATSATKAKTSEINAKASEANALSSKNAATSSANAAKTSEDNAKASETRSKASETNAATSASTATNKATEAATSASTATDKADEAVVSANKAKVSEDNAKESELKAAEYANAVAGGLVDGGSVDLSSGQYPQTPEFSTFWKVTKGGTVSGIQYGVGDTLIYSVHSGFFKIDNTESVSSVNGKTGVVTLTAADVGAMSEDGVVNGINIPATGDDVSYGVALASGTNLRYNNGLLYNAQKQELYVAQNVFVNDERVYTTGYKPTADDVGALPVTKSGSTWHVADSFMINGSWLQARNVDFSGVTRLRGLEVANDAEIDGDLSVTRSISIKAPEGANPILTTYDVSNKKRGELGWNRNSDRVRIGKFDGEEVSTNYIEISDDVTVSHKSLYEGDARVYSPNNKPTAADVNAVGKTGSQKIDGTLTLSSASKQLILKSGSKEWHHEVVGDNYCIVETGHAIRATFTGTYFGYAGEIREHGQRVYSPNNKPTKSDVGLGHVSNWPSTTSVSDPSNAKYATAGAVKTAYDKANEALTVANSKWRELHANTERRGIVQLSTAINSTSTGLAATPSAVKQAYDKANAALPKAGGSMTGSITLGSHDLRFTGSGSGAGDIIWLNGSNQEGRIWNSASTTLHISAGASTATTGAGVLGINTNNTLTIGTHQVYHEGHKPTAGELGVYTKAEVDKKIPKGYSETVLWSGKLTNHNQSATLINDGSSYDAIIIRSVVSGVKMEQTHTSFSKGNQYLAGQFFANDFYCTGWVYHYGGYVELRAARGWSQGNDFVSVIIGVNYR